MPAALQLEGAAGSGCGVTRASLLGIPAVGKWGCDLLLPCQRHGVCGKVWLQQMGEKSRV